MIKDIQRMTGTVKWYDDEKGFGFIRSDTHVEDIFLHHSALQINDDFNLRTGDRITFAIKNEKKGPSAHEVKRIVEEQDFIEVEKKARPQPVQNDVDINFIDFNLNPEILRAVRDAGYVKPTPIQAQAIPIVLKGKDMLGCAQTGTGKTAAYALPILQHLCKTSADINNNDNNNYKNKYNQSKVKNKIKKYYKPHITALIISPTRELAIQIKDSFNDYGKYTGLKSTVIYGGVGQNPQVEALHRGVNILVATPGRLLDLIRQGHVNLSRVKVLVLDEGDRMLDMGFINDIRSLVKMMPQKKRQTLLFSATIPQEIITLAQQILNDPIEICISPDKPTLETIKQAAFIIAKEDKQALLEHLLHDSAITRALVFTRTKNGANRVAKKLMRKKISAEAMHGDKSQNARQKALKSFRTGKTRVLVATDVASRGIDVDDISHVIQFDLPDVPETYLHRIGRTARAGAIGTAFAFCQQKERNELKKIEKFIHMKVMIIKEHPYRKRQ